MTYRLGKLIQDIFIELGQATLSIATGGAINSVLDAKLMGQNQDYTGWTVMVYKTTDGLAPQGEFARCSVYDNGTFTLDTPLSAAIGAGDIYMYASTLYPVQNMVKAANDGLRSLGMMALVDTATLTTIAGQTEYPAALEWKRKPPFEIAIQMNSVAGDYEWMVVRNWEFIPALPGQTGLIVFKTELDPGMKLRILYQDIHPELSDYDDVVSETIPEQVAVLAGANAALSWQNGRQQGGDNFLLQRENKAITDLANAEAKNPVWRPKRKRRLVIP